jgi:DNA-binding CsgD family transcriptional regulator
VAELLEREDLLAELEGARLAGGRLVFVGGEAGVGKTALVRAFSVRSERVLAGSCENLTTPTPLGPLLDIADVAAAGEPRLVANALLEELRPGTLLVLEDVHWADQATLDVLRVLGRRIDRTEAITLATYREDEVEADHPLRLVLGELASAAAVSRLSVPALSLDAARELAGPHGANADAIYELTRGNAFYVTEVLAAGGESLPPTVRDAVLARAAALSSAARRLLDVVSLVPARVELWLLEAVAPAEIEQLDACLASGMLREERDAVAFRHELARLAVEGAVPPQRRRRLNAAILRALASPPAGAPDPARLAHHAEEAGDIDAVLEHAKAAAHRAEQASAHREAVAQYERVLRVGDGLAPADRASILAAYAQQATLTGRYEPAIDAYAEAIALYGSLGDHVRKGETLSRSTSPYIFVGRNADAEAASRAGIDVLETLGESPELAVAYASQAALRMLNRDNDEGVAWGEKALTLAHRFADQETVAQALNLIGTSYVMAGEIERGIGFLDRSIDVARENDLAYRVASGYSMLGSGLGEMYELERSERYSRAFVAHAYEHGMDESYILSWLACVRVYRGDWREGTKLARRVLDRAGGGIARITALIALARVRARRGDPGPISALDEALELSRPGGHLQRLGHVQAARAEAAWLSGDRERCVEEARSVYGLALAKRHLWFGGELAYWQWKAGVLEDAPGWIAEPYRLQIAGEARAAADAWRAHGCPYETARALAEGDADAQLDALAELERLGAQPAVKLLRQALRAAGISAPRGPRPATRENPAELTTRELEVLRLVAEGKRNAEVADALVLSRRTVDHHVSAILRKLDVKSRGEAAAAASRLGLLEDR